MSRLTIKFRRVARYEYDAAVDWYGSQGAKLGTRFISQVETMLTQIAIAPERWPIEYANVRVAQLTKKWPYTICYEVFDNHIEVIAVYHTSRDSSGWQSRVDWPES